MDESSAQVLVGKLEPPQPTKTEKASRDLTLIVYRSWCPHCLMGRRPAAQHRSNSNAARNPPFVCADSVFVRDARDEELATLIVGRLDPKQ